MIRQAGFRTERTADPELADGFTRPWLDPLEADSVEYGERVAAALGRQERYKGVLVSGSRQGSPRNSPPK